MSCQSDTVNLLIARGSQRRGRALGKEKNKSISSMELDIFQDPCTLRNAKLILASLVAGLSVAVDFEMVRKEQFSKWQQHSLAGQDVESSLGQELQDTV